MPERQAKAALGSGLMWQAEKGERVRTVQAAEGTPHVRLKAAGDGNQDRVKASEALSKETESNLTMSHYAQYNE